MYFSAFLARRLRTAPQRAFTTIAHRTGIISVALGLSTSLVACLTMQGFETTITQKLTNLAGHLQVAKYALHTPHEPPPMERSKLRGLHQAFPGAIRATRAHAHKAMLLQANGEVEGVVCKGLDLAAGPPCPGAFLTAGQGLLGVEKGYSQAILLSSTTAARLGVHVGDMVLAHTVQQPARCRKLQVAGLYATHITAVDEKMAFCDLKLVQRLNNWPASLVGGWDVVLHQGHTPQAVAAQLLGWLDYDLNVNTTEQAHAAMFDWLRIIRQNAHLFLTLILLIVSTNLASIVLIQVMERRGMMGRLQALGATNGQLVRALLWRHGHMVGAGLAWGNALGLGGCALQWRWHLVRLDPAYYYVPHVPVAWHWPTILGLNALLLGVAATVLLATMGRTLRHWPCSAAQFR